MQVLTSHSQESSGIKNGGKYINSLGKEVFEKGLTPLSLPSFCLPSLSFLKKVSWSLSQNELMLYDHMSKGFVTI